MPAAARTFGSGGNAPLITTLNRLGLTTSLQLCLDAGDSASYTSGQSWLDRSGNGYDFFRGTTAASQSTDPTFNGTAGGLSSAEYWSFDGGDFFTYDTSNETWMNNLHKNSALFTVAAWMYLNTAAGSQRILSTASLATEIGVKLYMGPDVSRTINLDVHNGGGADITTSAVGGSSTASLDTWFFAAMSGDEAAGNWVSAINSSHNSQSGITYNSPSASSPTGTLTLGADYDASQAIESGGRMAMLAAWSRALSSAEFAALFNATRGRFGI